MTIKRSCLDILPSIIDHLSTDSGFTLVELLVAVSIMSITFAFGVAKYNEFNRRQILVQAAEELKSHLRSAQNKALAGEKECSACQVGGACGDSDDLVLNGWCVRLSRYGYEIYGSCGTGADEAIFPLPSTSIDLGSRSVEISSPPLNPICFRPLGQGVENPTAVDFFGFGETERIEVTATGEIK